MTIFILGSISFFYCLLRVLLNNAYERAEFNWDLVDEYLEKQDRDLAQMKKASSRFCAYNAEPFKSKLNNSNKKISSQRAKMNMRRGN